MSSKAAAIFKINAGFIKEGCPASLTLINPDSSWQVKKDEFKSKSSNSPFINTKFKARVETVIYRGKVVMENFKID
jgi:dihydroorotase